MTYSLYVAVCYVYRKMETLLFEDIFYFGVRRRSQVHFIFGIQKFWMFMLHFMATEIIQNSKNVSHFC